MSRFLLALALTLMAWVLGALGTLLPINEYDWSDEPGMKELVSPDAVLTVVVCCTLGLIAALASIAIARRLTGKRRLLLGTAALALVLCTYRLLTVLPVYSG